MGLRNLIVGGMMGLIPLAGVVGVGLVPPTTAEYVTMSEFAEAIRLNQQANEFGLWCSVANLGSCEDMIKRTKQSPKLRAAIQSVASTGVTVELEDGTHPNSLLLAGRVTNIGNVAINPAFGDDAIIEFLTPFLTK